MKPLFIEFLACYKTTTQKSINTTLEFLPETTQKGNSENEIFTGSRTSNSLCGCTFSLEVKVGMWTIMH